MTFFGAVNFILNGLYHYAFLYPVLMAYVWIIGSLIYFFRVERKVRISPVIKNAKHAARVTILIPCFNEEDTIRDSLNALTALTYPRLDIVAINDGSTDGTQEILDEITNACSYIRSVQLAENQGKAAALRYGAMVTDSEFIVVIDADALLQPDTVDWLVSPLLDNLEIGAVTGNPRIRTRSSILGKIQVGEYSTIIGIIKRAQSIYGRFFTVSGCLACFRRSALHDIGYWHSDTVTEDIDVSWRLQLAGWRLVYEPNAMCWLLMPETLKGLWRQRLRWAHGGAQVFLKCRSTILQRRSWHMLPIVTEYCMGLLWSYTMLLIGSLWVFSLFYQFEYLKPPSLLPGWSGVVIGVTFLLQFAVSLAIDSKYEKGLGKFYFWIIWYPIVYWTLQAATSVVGFSKVIFSQDKNKGRWVSPDRGISLKQSDRGVDVR